MQQSLADIDPKRYKLREQESELQKTKGVGPASVDAKRADRTSDLSSPSGPRMEGRAGIRLWETGQQEIGYGQGSGKKRGEKEASGSQATS